MRRRRTLFQKADSRRRSLDAALSLRWARSLDDARQLHSQVPRRHLDNYLLPEFGDRVPAEITPADAARLLAKVSKRAPTAANDLLRFMRRVFRFGVQRHLLPSNPVADFDQQDAGGPERTRRRALSRGEMEDLFAALRDSPSFDGENFLAIKLLLALGVRKGELLKATWDEFDFEGAADTGAVWRLPGRRTKTGESLTIPLVPQVVEWLQALRLVAGGSLYVFPKRRRDPRNRSPHVGIDTLNAALASVEHGVAHFTLHDLRRTMRTHLAALGVRSEVAERCLGQIARRRGHIQHP
jgi:integrase